MKVAFFYAGYESMGVEYLVSMLEKHSHQCELFFDPLLFSENTMIRSKFLGNMFNVNEFIVKDFLEFDPDIACFSVVTDEYQWCIKMANQVKSLKDIPVVFGGIHPTSIPEIVLQEKSVDFIIRGEGEYALLELIEKINGDYYDIKNLCYKKDGQLIINELRPPIEDLDQLPFPNKKIFYDKAESLGHGYLVLTARGCPNNCTYCNNNVMKKLYPKNYLRRRSVDNVIAELTEAKTKYKFNHIKFIDELFTYDKAWLREFCEKYNKFIKIPYSVSVHPNTIDEEIVLLLKNSMCYAVVMGIQTTDYTINKNILNRNTTTEKIMNALALFKKHNLVCMVDMIFGLPSLTEKEVINSFTHFKDTTPDLIRVFWLRYYPKTEIADKAKELGMLTDQDVEEINKAMNVKGLLQGGDTYKKTFNKYANLMLLYPIMSKSLKTFILKKKLFSIFGIIPPYVISLLFLRTIIFLNKIKFYTYSDRVKLKYREFTRKIIRYKLFGYKQIHRGESNCAK